MESFGKLASLPLMSTVITNPPDAGYSFKAGAAGAGSDFLAAALGAFFWLVYRLFGIFYILLLFFVSIIRHS
jgi:hypothetical protein